MVHPLRIYLCAVFVFLALLAPAEGAVVNATWNSATDVPVTASSYTVTGNTVNLTLSFAPPTGTNLTVVKNTGLPFINGTFDNLAQGQAVDLSYGGVTYHFVANYYGGTGNDLVLVWAFNRVFAWGFDPSSGGLGDGTTAQRNLPVPVTATGVLAGKTVTALAAGAGHMLALCSDGTLAAWGGNGNGQLGTNAFTNQLVPQVVNSASGVSALYGKTVVAIAAGNSHSMALCSDGTIATWGWNSTGQLGINSTSRSLFPVAINTESGVSALYGKSVVAIAAGSMHSMALCSDGAIVTWGYNAKGQLGNNSITDSWVPVAVNTSSGISALYGKTVAAVYAGSAHNLALCTDGTLAAWGYNASKQLGDNSNTDRIVPVLVNTANGTSVLFNKTVVAAVAGGTHSMALCSDGILAAWGSNDGQIGDNTTVFRATPVAVNTTISALHGKTVAALAAGYYHSVALCTDGTLASWGVNTNGELGDNTTTQRLIPVAVNRSMLAAPELFAGVVGTSQSFYHTPAVVAGPPPIGTATLAPTAVTATSVILNGIVNANNNSTAVSFEYGVTTAYGTTVTGAPTPVVGASDTAVSAALSGLTPATTYHFRVKGVSSVGTFNGGDLTFTTPSDNAALSGLALSAGTLSPSFTSAMKSYTASVPQFVASMTFTPTVADSTATVKVNGATVASGSTTAALPLSAGDNVFNVVVTAQDGTTTQTYAVTVTRTAASAVPATFAAATDVPFTVSSLTATGSTVNLSLNYPPATGTNLMVVNNTGVPLINGTFDNLAQGQAVLLSYNGVTYKFVANYYGGTGNDLVLAWAANRAFAWGDNSTAQIGDGTGTQRNVMVPVNATGVLAGKTILALSQGSGHSLGLCSDGTLAAWGTNFYGTLGNGNNTSINFPVTVNTANGVSALYGRTVVGVSAGTYFSLAVCSDGSVVSWGYNQYGQLGNNGTTNTNAPVLVNTTSGTSALNGKTVVAVSAGAYHSVALCSDGTVAAWGYNNTGQLGNNTTTNSTVPVAVNTTNGISALYGKTVVAISAGDQHTMALCSDGTVVAWGDNIFGDLGNNSGVQMKVPVAVNTTNGVSALYGKTVVGIAAGNWLSLALCTDGTVAAWGYNNAGQLGNNTTTNSSVPLQVSTASGTSALYGKTVVGIAAVGSSCTALCTDGMVATWGYNYYGQLGNNTTNNSLVPQLALTTPLNAGERVINPSRVANEGQSLALVAEPVPTVTTLAATAVGSANATLNGTVNPNNGIAVAVSFDYGTTTAYGSSVTATPGSVTGGSDTAVSAALSGLAPNTTYHFRVKAAGFPGSDQTFTTLSNDASLAGLASSAGALSPAFASGTISYATPAMGSGTTSVTCTPTVSESHATVTVNGVAVTSGSSSGPISLGAGTSIINVQVTAQDGVTKQAYTIAVPTVTSVTFATALDVPVSANGFSAAGSTMSFSLNYAPVTGANLMVANNTGLSFISGTFSNLSQGQAVGIVYNGVKYNYVANYYGGTGNDLVLVWAGNRALGWGDNLNALLGDGTSTKRLVPTPVTATGVLAGKVVVATSAGYSHGLALCSDGTVAAWGGNWYGQLGDNTYTSRATPVAVNTASGVSALYGKTVVAIGAGYEWSMALCSDGTVVSWGYNSIGQLGDGSTTNRVAPVAVSRGSGVSALYGKSVVGIAAGASHSLALCSDGTLVAWGSNSSGRLGNNSANNSAVPVLVNTANGVSSLYGKTPQMVAAGTSNSLVLCSDGSLASWGDNTYGQLGDNTLTNRSVPGVVNAVNGISALYGKTPVFLAAGSIHAMALCTDGTVVAWGYNASGQLGDNSTTSRPAAVVVNAGNGISALYGKTVVGLTAGASTSAAFCADGSIATWGANSVGQLGNNTTSNSSVPVAVSTSTLSPGERFASVGTGSYSSAMFATAAAPPAAPAAATLAATSITTTGATLNGTANASGNFTTVSFEYGLTTTYGTTVAATPATLTDSSTTAVGASLTGLTPGTTYHYRVKAVSGAGTANGSDLTFTTISTNANLTGLALNNGTLSPVFAGGTTSYTATVAYPVTSITLRPTLANAGASVTVNGLPVSSGSASAPVSLSVGGNTLTTVVTAQDGTTTQTYTVAVTRAAPSTNALLASLTPSVGILSPAFDSSATSYTVTVPFGATSMTLTPTVADSTSSVQVNGTHVTSGSASGPLTVNVGSNFFSVVVTAQDGVSTQTYSVTGVRPALPAVWSTLSDVPLVTTGFTATGNTLGALTLNFAPATGTNLMVVKNTGLGFISGTFSNLSQGQAVAIVYNGVTYNFVANYYGGTGNDLVLQWAGNHALAWGYNGDGELGDGTTTQRNTAVSVTATGVLAGKTILSLAMGAKHSLALCSDGTLAAWGGNTSGQLGDNTTTDRLAPVMVNNSIGISALYGKTVIAIAAGQSHSLALCSDGTVVAWGENLYYQLGETTTTQRNAPVQVNSSSGISALFGKTVVAVAAGARHNLALCSDGSVAAWGANTSGQLGDNTASPRSAAVAVNAASGLSALNGRIVVAVAAGGLHSIALCTDGTVLAWGNDINGELGDDNAAQFYTNSPVAVAVMASSGSALFGKSVVSIVAGYAHSLAQCSDGSLVAWGSNAFGQLGDTTTNNGYVPVTVSTASGVSALNGKTVSAISAGARHSMAQCTDGTLTAWGLATSGQLGNNSTTSSSAPVAVSSTPLAAGEVFVRAASGAYALHTLALVAEPPPPPTVTTLAATGVGSTSAYLNATVNASNSITAVSFDYGTTTAYGSSAGDGYLGAVGSGDTPIIIQLTGLAPATTYHFRVKGTSGAGTASGSDLIFTTLNNDASLSGVTLSTGTLTPAFSSDVFNYTTTVSSDTTSITLTPTVNDSNAVVALSLQSGVVSGPINLVPGDTRIGMNVTAQDGTKRNYQVVVTRFSVVQEWRQQKFGTMANSGSTADAADYDGDGIPNLIEYALSLNPKSADKLPVASAINGANFEYTYTRSTAAVNAGAIFTVQWSNALSAGSWSSNGVTQTVLSDDGTNQQVKAVIPMNAATSMFLHLSVIAPP